jgi:hypothetical protein
MTKPDRDDERAAVERRNRLASALRANLRRRKEQARGREAPDPADARNGEPDSGEEQV